MSQINPFVPAVAGTPLAQRQQSAEKSQQVRRTQILSKSAIVPDDQFEHQVESADRVGEVHDEGSSNGQRQPRKQHPPKDAEPEPPHIDITG